MAETSDKAFGRYLRTLRERRGLALHDVASLSSSFPEAITKGYLSRCENGYLTPSFSKVIALSRIYEVPADVLVERMELDMELDRLGGPSTEGMTFSELTLAGKDKLRRGRRWEAYAFLREAVTRSTVDPIELSYAHVEEQSGCSVMNLGSAARALGRYRFALHEFEFLWRVASFPPRRRPVVLERLANCHLAIGSVKQAREFADLSVDSARELAGCDFLGYALHTRAQVALAQADHALAITLYRQAFHSHKQQHNEEGCALALNCIAQCFFDTRRYRAARRSCDAAMRIATMLGQERTRAMSLILLGELDEIDNRPQRAAVRWKEAAQIGLLLRDRQLRFKSEFVLYRHALKNGDSPVARAIERRLNRLAPSVPTDTAELDHFRRSRETSAGTHPVSLPQR